MADSLKANRQVCDVDIRILKNMQPFMYFDTANVTTVGLTGDAVYAMAKGTRRIAFQNPMEGTATIEAQVYPFKLFAMLSDGVIEDSAIYAGHTEVTAASTTALPLAVENGTIQAGSVFVYPADSYGDEDALMEVTFADGNVSGTFETGKKYEIGYIVNRTGVKKVSFNNAKLPADLYITMNTLDKDEVGVLTPFVMTLYKASPQRNWELSFNSEGDPATVTINLDLLEDKDGNMVDLIELTGDAE